MAESAGCPSCGYKTGHQYGCPLASKTGQWAWGDSGVPQKEKRLDALLTDLRDEVERYRKIGEDPRWHPFISEQRRVCADRLQALIDKHAPKQEGAVKAAAPGVER